MEILGEYTPTAAEGNTRAHRARGSTLDHLRTTRIKVWNPTFATPLHFIASPSLHRHVRATTAVAHKRTARQDAIKHRSDGDVSRISTATSRAMVSKVSNQNDRISRHKNEGKFAMLICLVLLIAIAFDKSDPAVDLDPSIAVRNHRDAVKALKKPCQMENAVLCNICTASVTSPCRGLYSSMLRALLHDRFLPASHFGHGGEWDNRAEDECFFENSLDGFKEVAKRVVLPSDKPEESRDVYAFVEFVLQLYYSMYLDVLEGKRAFKGSSFHEQPKDEQLETIKTMTAIFVSDVRFALLEGSFCYLDDEGTHEACVWLTKGRQHKINASDLNDALAMAIAKLKIDDAKFIDLVTSATRHLDIVSFGTKPSTLSRGKLASDFQAACNANNGDGIEVAIGGTVQSDLSNQFASENFHCLTTNNNRRRLLTRSCKEKISSMPFSPGIPYDDGELVAHDVITVMTMVYIFITILSLILTDCHRRQSPQVVKRAQRFKLMELKDPVLNHRPKTKAMKLAQKEGITDPQRLEERQGEMLEQWKLNFENTDIKSSAHRRFLSFLKQYRRFSVGWAAFAIIVAVVFCFGCRWMTTKDAMIFGLVGPATLSITYLVPAWNDLDKAERASQQTAGMMEPLLGQ